MDKHNTYTIGQLAARTDIPVETIRYYERRGLLDQPIRPSTGYRRYVEDARRRLEFIRKAKALGFSLGEILELLELSTGSGAACGKVEELAARSKRRIEEELPVLLQMNRELSKLIAECRAGELKTHCPIIEAMEEA